MTSDFNPVFVGGYMRSGTTLLRSLLDRHPSLSVANETFFMMRIATKQNRKLKDHASLLKQWWDEPACAGQGLEHEAFRRRFESYPPDVIHLFRAGLEEYAAQRGKVRCGEKTPENERQSTTLFEWYPNAKLIFIVRDPRAVYASILKVPFGFKNPSTLGVRWAIASLNARRLERKFPDRVRIVRYEDLLQNPESLLSCLMPWLDLKFSPAQLDSTVATRSFHDADKPYMALASRPVEASRAEAWIQELSPVQASQISLAAGKEFLKWGYVAGPSCLTWKQRQRGLFERRIHSFLLGPYIHPVVRTLKQLCRSLGFDPNPWHEANRWMSPDGPESLR